MASAKAPRAKASPTTKFVGLVEATEPSKPATPKRVPVNGKSTVTPKHLPARKTCRRCQQTKTRDRFPQDLSVKADLLSPYCRDCQREMRAARVARKAAAVAVAETPKPKPTRAPRVAKPKAAAA